jgi:hypothetical protein
VFNTHFECSLLIELHSKLQVRRSEIVEFVEEDQVVYGSGEVLDFSHEPPNDFWGLDSGSEKSPSGQLLP